MIHYLNFNWHNSCNSETIWKITSPNRSKVRIWQGGRSQESVNSKCLATTAQPPHRPGRGFSALQWSCYHVLNYKLFLIREAKFKKKKKYKQLKNWLP